MYTLQCAASVLGVSLITVRRWIAQAGIKTVIIPTDIARAYITHNDVLTLAHKNFRKLVKLDKMTNQGSNSPEQVLYTMEEIAKFIGVSQTTVKRWLKESGIEKKFIVSDRMRVYISYRDMLELAIQHRINFTRKYAKIGGREDITSLRVATGRDKDLYTLKEISQFFNVSLDTVERWIRKFNISKEHIYTDKNRTYIHRSDVLMLARQHQMRTSPEKRHEQGLSTVKEAALFIGVSERRVYYWINKFKISKLRMSADKRCMCIRYSDVLMLADWYQKTKEQSHE